MAFVKFNAREFWGQSAAPPSGQIGGPDFSDFSNFSNPTSQLAPSDSLRGEGAGETGRCCECGQSIAAGHVRCRGCAHAIAERFPKLPVPCPGCHALEWVYDTIDLRRCVECGNAVELPPLRDPVLVRVTQEGVVSETCMCAGMADDQRCRVCTAAAVARGKAGPHALTGHGALQRHVDPNGGER